MKRKIYISGFSLIFLYVILLIPEPDNTLEAISGYPTTARPFAWNKDAYWDSLENQYLAARAAGCRNLTQLKNRLTREGDSLVSLLAAGSFMPESKIFSELENTIFAMTPIVAACPDWLTHYIQFYARVRSEVKRQSEKWDMNSFDDRQVIYRLLYGFRSATEEIILQVPDGYEVDPYIAGTDEPSVTPAGKILGIKVHSGDILVSRGGAPTSALIARGDDFAGNFSHVALVYVDYVSHDIKLIESHIEFGVKVSSVDDYLKDTKLRIMVLRLRSDLPQILDDPAIPHKAAGLILSSAYSRHIPYDFEMDVSDSMKMFCSEVVSFAYNKLNVKLWIGISHISSPGLRNWLGSFGVRYFETQKPSDLEYDPQLRVVAEWRDLETLRKDHYDNAVTEVMLEDAETGMRLQYDWYMLPVARVLKAYSYLLNLFGGVGPIPEGMTAAVALKNKWYSDLHSEKKKKLEDAADEFKKRNYYEPPYWELIRMVRDN